MFLLKQSGLEPVNWGGYRTRMVSKYFLLFKTGQAELRCWQNFSHEHKKDITPIIELTRGRKIPRAGKDIAKEDWPFSRGIFNYQKNIDAVTKLFSDNTEVVLDITKEPSLLCAELDEIADSYDGYARWRKFCLERRGDGLLNLIPTLIINPSDNENVEDYKNNVQKQLDDFMNTFRTVAYRALVLQDTEFLYDIILLKDRINFHIHNGRRFILILDHEFILTGTGMLHALRTIQIIQNIKKLVPLIEIVILATSFPSSVTELGGEEEGAFRAEEAYLYDEIMRQINNNKDIYYGDYGSINPIRNDLTFSRGWRPRIDFPTKDRRFFYYRERRDSFTYAEHYISVASKIIHDSRFDKDLQSWGVAQILDAASGHVPSSAPSFWISVRMEMFLQRQVTRLFS